jgi:hypothetical protein
MAKCRNNKDFFFNILVLTKFVVTDMCLTRCIFNGAHLKMEELNFGKYTKIYSISNSSIFNKVKVSSCENVLKVVYLKSSAFFLG